MPLSEITNNILTLKKSDPSLEALKLLFEVILAPEEEIAITLSEPAQESPSDLTVKGSANTWGAQGTLIQASYKKFENDQYKIRQLIFTKAINGFEGVHLADIIPAISFEALNLHLNVNVLNEGDSTTGVTTLDLTGTFKIKDVFSLPFKIAHPGASNRYFIDLEFEQANAPGLEDLAALLGVDSDPKKDFGWLPEPLRTKPIALEDIAFGIDLDEPKKLVRAEIKIGILPGEIWQIVPDILAVGDLWVDLEIDDPLDPDYRFPIVTAGGTIQIGSNPQNGQIHLTARWPDYSISGELVEGQTIQVGELLEHIKLLKTEDAGLDQMEISRLSFLAEPVGEVKTFDFFIQIDEVWRLAIRPNTFFEIQEIQLSLNHSSEPSVGTGGRFEAILGIAGANIDLQAAFSKDSGWQFEGSTGSGQDIPIGDLIQELANKFEVDANLPAPIKDLSIKNLHISFNTKSKNFNFGCEIDFPVEGKEVAILLNIELTKQGSAYQKDLTGQIRIGFLQFDLHFLQDNNSTLFAATYSHEGESQTISLKRLLSQFSNQIDHIPLDLAVDLKDMIFVFDKKQNEASKFLFALDINASLNLSRLPLVGKEFPPDKSVGVDNLQFILANAKIPQKDIQNLLPSTVTPLPARELKKGLSIDGKLNLGGFSESMDLPVSDANTPPAETTSASAQSSTPPNSDDKAKWFTLQKQIGPIYFERIGVKYENGELWFLLDASLTAAGLTIALQGLSVGSSLQRFEPKFRLNGLGIDYKKGPLEIGGAFLRFGESEYDGTAIIKTEALTLAAIGSYAELSDGHKSLFIYAVLDYPLGGPAFFFVTGLAAGFGYNRRLNVPSIDQVANFPLISEAVNGTPPLPSGAEQRNALMGELTKLRTYIPPEAGQYFLAVGIKFNSFKIIDSFALLTVSFGNQFELDLLGLSTLVAPTPEASQSVEPLAEVQMAIKASFIPSEGFLGVEAQLTTASFLLSRKCHLTGGFAFYSWFKGAHKGDFVISVGGYHPSYKVPAHYPTVPRLGFNWQVTQQLSLKGEAYFALTASALMAGGRLEAMWVDGNLKAWFIAGADFLIAWKPYHYDARVYVDMGVFYTFHFFGTHTISVGIGADLHIWGPDFSGTAHVKLWIVTFDVRFGAGTSQSPQPIDWTTFRTSFLPAADKDIASISLINGLKRQVDANSELDWIVDVKHLEFETNSIIPIKQGAQNKSFGIAPMNLKSGEVNSSFEVKIKNPAGDDISTDFSFEPILKNVPTGMWGTSVNPSLNGKKFISNALTGYRIKLTKQEKEPENKPDPIDRHKFQFSTTELAHYIHPVDLQPFQSTNYPNWKDRLKQNRRSNANRDEMLSALGFSIEADVQVSDTYVDELIFAPQFAGAGPS